MDPEVNEVQPATDETLKARIVELEASLKEKTEQLAVADELLSEADANTPEKCDYKLSNTNPAKVAFVSDELRPAFGKYLMPIIIRNLKQFYQGNGANMTIGQDAMIFTAQDGSTLRVSLSLNHWGPKAGAKVASKDRPEETLGITQAEYALIDTAYNKAKAGNDFDGAVRLATIKTRAKERHDRVTFDEMVVIKSLKS